MNIMRLIHFVGICLLFAVIDATFLVEPDTSSTGCIGGTHNFPWTYDVTVNNAFAVVWQKDGSNILSWRLSTNKYIYGTNYSSVKVAHSNTNGAITIKSLDSSDAGIYVCIVTYDVSFDESKSNGSTLVLNSCTSGGGGGGGFTWAWILTIIVAVIVIISSICCLLNKRCGSRFLRKDSRCLFTCPGKDIVVYDIHEKDFKIERPEGENIEIQCLRTKEGRYKLNGTFVNDATDVRVRNTPSILFNPHMEINCLKMEHEGYYKYELTRSSKSFCSLTLEIRKAINIFDEPFEYWAHEGEWLKLQPPQTSFGVRWIKKNSKTGKETRMPNRPKNNSLVLKNVNNEDEGFYIAEHTSKDLKIGIFTLNIVNSLVTVGTKDGSHVTIVNNSVKLKFTECMLSSIKRLKWKKYLSTEGTEIREFESTSNYELILSKVTFENGGRYWCEVEYNNGTSTKSGILTLQVVHAIVDVGMKSASYKATIGDSIQIQCTKKMIPYHIIFSAKRSGSNQITPKPTKTQIDALSIEKMSKGDEGCYQFESADGKVKTGVTTLSLMKDNERSSSVYNGKSDIPSQPRRNANQTLESITEKVARKKKKKVKKGQSDNEEEKIKENGDKTDIDNQPPDKKDASS